LNQLRNQEAAAEVDQFAANPFTGPTRNWQAPAPVIPQITVPAPAQGGAPSVDNFSSYATQVQFPPVAKTVTGNVPTVTAPPFQAMPGPNAAFVDPAQHFAAQQAALAAAQAAQAQAGITSKGSYTGMPIGLLGPK